VRTLVVVAHPDDPDFQAGGTIANWTAAGDEVVYCVITDGAAGGNDTSVPPAERAAIRMREQQAAADVLGVKEVRFLGYPDGRLTAGLDVRRDISRVIRQVRPERVLIQSPEVNFSWLPDAHPDHRAAGEAALAAVYPDARNPFAHPELLDSEGLEPWEVPEMWVMTGPSPDHYVDVTDSVELKLAALRAHTSQTAHLTGLDQRVRIRLAATAARGGLPDGRMAEAFRIVHC
jgi:LmbE family N-acetylglucosaminyl deacetylase